MRTTQNYTDTTEEDRTQNVVGANGVYPRSTPRLLLE